MTLEKVYEVISIQQIINETSKDRYSIKCPDDVANHAYDLIGTEDREVFLVMVMNVKNHVVAVHRCHVGSLNSSIVHPREVYKSAILNNGASIIGIHQHPSGNPQPSPEDIDVTKRLVEAGEILGIQYLDSIVLGEKENGVVKYVSLKEKGYM